MDAANKLYNLAKTTGSTVNLNNVESSVPTLNTYKSERYNVSINNVNGAIRFNPEDDEIVEISSSIESGIDMEGSMTFSDRSDDEDLPIERRPRSNTSSGRRSMVVNNEVRRSKGSIKFSNTTVFMESLHNTFFNSNLMEELNKLHEDYFSLSQFETERTDTTDLETPDLSPEQGLQNIDPILMNFPNNVAQVFRWPKKKERSVTERLQIKTAILLAAVVVIIVGEHPSKGFPP